MEQLQSITIVLSVVPNVCLLFKRIFKGKLATFFTCQPVISYYSYYLEFEATALAKRNKRKKSTVRRQTLTVHKCG